MAEDAKYQRLNNDDEGSAPEDEESGGGIKDCVEEKCGYPAQVYFILGNEFCERFSYYGMHAILVLYLTSMLKMDKDDATAVYHAFNMLCYFSPIFGAIIADSFWGKYKTILYISLIYAIGNIVVSFTAVPSILDQVKLAGPAIGLLLIAIGTGGIKPCVSAFGGDQFKAGQEDMLQSFFSIFYFAINVGSLISMLVTPILRGDVQCFGYDCYPLAFGVPAALMIISVVLFVAGSRLYTKVPPEGNVVVEVSGAVGFAIKERLRHCGSGIKKNHWMDWASERYNPTLISDIKALFKVLFMFLPLPVFWTLFDQQGSRWTLQAMEMNGDIGVFGTLKPDQMQALNPVFVMILIPFVEVILYPVLKKCGLLTKPLQKMACGMALAGLSFVAAGFLQMKMETKSSVANLPATGYANLRIINAYPCSVDVYSPLMKKTNLTIPYESATEYFAAPLKMTSWNMSTKCEPEVSLESPIKLKERGTYTYLIPQHHNDMFMPQMLVDDITPLPHGFAKVRFVHSAAAVEEDITVKMNKTLIMDLEPLQDIHYMRIISKSYNIRVTRTNGSSKAIGLKKMTFGNGGIYTLVIQPNKKKDGVHIFRYEDVSPRPVSILWQIPQYLIITMGEVMFSITGLEFAYSQSPPSMKSCIMAAWLLTVSIGNLLVVIMAGLKLTEDMAKEFFFFSIMIAVVTLLFCIMAYFYKYVNYGSTRETAPSGDGGNEENIPLIENEKKPPIDDTKEPPDEGGGIEKGVDEAPPEDSKPSGSGEPKKEAEPEKSDEPVDPVDEPVKSAGESTKKQ